MKLGFVLCSAFALASCTADVKSNPGPAQTLPEGIELTDSPAAQDLKVAGLPEGSDGINQVSVVNPNATPKEFIFAIDAKATGTIELSLQSSIEVGCTDGGLSVVSYWEEVLSGVVREPVSAEGPLTVVAGHSYRVRFVISATGACSGYSQDFEARFTDGSASPTEPVPTPDQPSDSNACDSRDDIGTFFANAADGEWCAHSVTNPAQTLVGGRSIDASQRLDAGTKLAIVAGKKTFAEAAAVCAGLGSGWSLPLSTHEYAEPRATAAGKSLDSVGLYLSHLKYLTIWSASGVSDDSASAWMSDLASNGAIFQSAKNEKMPVICVR
jgi:hypothetical protein